MLYRLCEGFCEELCEYKVFSELRIQVLIVELYC